MQQALETAKEEETLQCVSSSFETKRIRTTYNVHPDGSEDGARNLRADLGCGIVDAAGEFLVARLEQKAESRENENGEHRDDSAVEWGLALSTATAMRGEASGQGATVACAGVADCKSAHSEASQSRDARARARCTATSRLFPRGAE